MRWWVLWGRVREYVPSPGNLLQEPKIGKKYTKLLKSGNYFTDFFCNAKNLLLCMNDQVKVFTYKSICCKEIKNSSYIRPSYS